MERFQIHGDLFDLRKPPCPSLLDQPGIDRDTIPPPAAEVTIGTRVMIQPVAMHRLEERW